MSLKEDGAPPSLLRRVLRAFKVPPSREPLHSVLGGRQIPEGCVPPAAAGPWGSPLPRQGSSAQTPPPTRVGVMGGGRPRETGSGVSIHRAPPPLQAQPGRRERSWRLLPQEVRPQLRPRPAAPAPPPPAFKSCACAIAAARVPASGIDCVVLSLPPGVLPPGRSERWGARLLPAEVFLVSKVGSPGKGAGRGGLVRG